MSGRVSIGVHSTCVLTRRIFLDLLEGFSEVCLILVGRMNNSRTLRNKLFDNNGVGRVQIAGNEVWDLEVLERVEFDEIVPFVGAAVDGHPQRT